MTKDKPPQKNEKPQATPERPLECSGCKKPIAVQYTEIIGDHITNTVMCKDCPILHQSLHGTKTIEASSEPSLEQGAGLCCGNCGTNLESIRTGNPVGCEECYSVFSDVLVQEMVASKKISHRHTLKGSKKSLPIHVGRSPGETAEVNPSLRVIALNEALNEVLIQEDYEQAAWLRDQIKELTKKAGQSDKGEQANGK